MTDDEAWQHIEFDEETIARLRATERVPGPMLGRPAADHPAVAVARLGGIYSVTRVPWRWWQRPRWLWRLR